MFLSIWGVIHLGLLAYMVSRRCLPAHESRMRSIGWLYVASGVANSVDFSLALQSVCVEPGGHVRVVGQPGRHHLRLSPFTRGVGAAERWTTYSVQYLPGFGLPWRRWQNTATVLLDWNWSAGRCRRRSGRS